MKNQLNQILQKQMDRKEFLKNLGLGVAVVVGLGSVVKLLKTTDAAPKKGYGSAAYGGKMLDKAKS